MEAIVIDTPIKLSDISPKPYLAVQNNPFNQSDTTRIIVPVGVKVSEALKDIEYDIELYDIVIYRNQELVDTEIVTEEYDVINITFVPKGGGGGGLLAMVAMVALAFVAPYAAGYMATAMFTNAAAVVSAGALFGTAFVVGTAMTAGIMIAGSMLISSLFKPTMPSSGSGIAQSQTYSFNVQGNSLQQGGAIPIVYGTHKVTGTYISKHTRQSGNTQLLRTLIGLCEGPVDKIYNINVNSDSIAKFEGVRTDFRLGTNSQSVIPMFATTWIDKSVGRNLPSADDADWDTTWDDYVSTITDGDSITSFTVGVLFPRGLFFTLDNGSPYPYSVFLDIEYKKVGDINWTTLGDNTHLTNLMYYYVDQNPTLVQRNTNVSHRSTYSNVPEADDIGPYDVYTKDTLIFPSYANFVNTITTLPSDVSEKSTFMTGQFGIPEQFSWSKEANYVGTPYFEFKDELVAPVRRQIRATGLPIGKYEIRMRYSQKPIFAYSKDRYGYKAQIEYIQEGTDDHFKYPNTALLATEITATDQLSGGLPTIDCLVTRTTGAYGRLDNPAWAALDLLMNTRYGAGVPLSRINFATFQEWANYCDEILSNGQKRFTCNVVIDSLMSLDEALNLMGQLGHARVAQFGSTFSVIIDKPMILPSQGFLFSMGNIIQSSFSEVFLPLKDRANVLEITYYDATNNYDRTTVEISRGNYDLVSNVNKQSINLVGCTNRNQAIRQAYYHLNQNRFLTITASWEASIDSIHCNVGDIVNVAHDVPQWGYSGRIISNTANTITVDRHDLAMPDALSTYWIQVSDANTDDQVYVEVTSITANVLTLAIGTTLSTLGYYSVYTFGEVNRHAKKFRIISISTAGDLKRKITAIEYYDEVYGDLVVTEPDEVMYDLATKNITITEFLEISADGTILPVLSLSWVGASLSYTIEYSRTTEKNWVALEPCRTTFTEIRGLQEGVAYVFKVDGVITTPYTVQGKITPPPSVSSLTGTEEANTFTLQWLYPYKPLDFARFLIYQGLTLIGSTQSETFITGTLDVVSSATFDVIAEDTTGNKSPAVQVIVPLVAVPQVTNVYGDITNGRLSVFWTYANKPNDFSHFNIYDSSVYIGNATANTFTMVAKNYTGATETIYVEAVDIVGNLSPKVSIAIGITNPTVGVITTSFVGDKINIDWDETQGSYKIDKYIVTIDGNEYYSSVSQLTLPIIWHGTKTIYITAKDTSGRTTTSSTSLLVKTPKAPVVTMSIINGKATFTVVQVAEAFSVDKLEVSYDSTVINVSTGTATWSIDVFWGGIKTFSFVSVDVHGGRSSTTTSDVTISSPIITNVTASIIDNNVLLKWSYTEGTLPIEHFIISKGITYAGATEIGIRKGSFTSVFEDKSGEYTYWVTPIDTAGNAGTYKQVITSVSQPPDFVLNVDWTSDWSGTATNVKMQDGKGILPINLTETYQAHFTTRSWTTAQNQIDAGYPLWLTPNNATSEYTQIFDYGTTLGTTAITLTDPAITQHGTGVYTMARQISTSLDGITYTNHTVDVVKVFVTNIRYVKVKYTWTVESDVLLEVGNFNLRLDAKLINDSGSDVVTNATTGKVVYFNKPFVDITAISVTPAGTTPVIAVYDFSDVPNPTQFTVYLFNTSGTKITGNFSWSAKGY